MLAAPVLLASACTSARHAAPASAPASVPMSATVSVAATTSSTSAPAPPTTATSRTRTAAARPAVRPPATSSSRKPSRAPARPAQPPAPTTDPLTGGRPSTNPVIAVKIDNTYFAVPQFGVSDADVVYVEQVEGGLTRLICVFHTRLPSEVGPVRSVRSTDAQLLPVFGRPALVFAGGAGGPMAALAATPVIDTTGLTGAYFRSDVAAGTYNLHANLQTVAAQVKVKAAARGIGFTFAARSSVVAAGRPVGSLSVVMEAGVTNFSFSGGRFVLMRDGEPVRDYQGGVEAADNVLVQHVLDEPDGTVDTLGSPSYLSRTVGSGAVSLFRNGRMIGGTWQRARPGDPFRYRDATGKPLPFKPGTTWVILAPQSAQVTVG